MPHIPKDEYEPVRNGGMLPTAGRLNWLVTDTIIDFINKEGLCYMAIDEVRVAIEELKAGVNLASQLTGAIRAALSKAYPTLVLSEPQRKALFGNVWDEFYRLVAGPYENEAMNRNGNAYERLWNVEYQRREAAKQQEGKFRPGFKMEIL